MNTKLTFTAFLQDEYSKRFEQLAGKSEKEIKDIERNLSKLGKTGKSVARSIDDINKRIDTLTRIRKISVDTRAIKFATREIKELQKERDRLEGNKNSGGGGSSVWNMAQGVAIAHYGPQLIQRAINVVKGHVEANMEREQQRISLGVLMGSQDKGDAMLEKITQEAARTPFGTEDLLKSTQTMLGFGVAQDKVLGIMRQLGDISGGNADRFQSLTLAFSQMSSTGRLMGQDLLQMVNAGFNPLNEISKMTGKSMAVLKKEMEDGKISAELVMKAMQQATGEGGLYHGMMDKQSKTTAGRLSTLKDEYNELSVSIGGKLIPLVNASIDALSEQVAEIRGYMSIPVSEKLQKENVNVQVLTKSITSLNEGNEVRKVMLEELVQTYPDLFGKLDIEKVKNEELLKILERVNDSYERRIQLAISEEKFNKAQEDMDGSLRVASLAQQAIARFEMGDTKGATSLINQALGRADLTGLGFGFLDKSYTKSDAQRLLRDANTGIKTNAKNLGNAKREKTTAEGVSQILELATQMDAGEKLPADVMAEVKRMRGSADKYVSSGGTINDFFGYDFGILNKAGKQEKGTPTTGASASDGKGSDPSISGTSKITHLTINIDSLVKGGVNIQNTTIKENATQMADVVKEALLTAVNDANLAVGR